MKELKDLKLKIKKLNDKLLSEGHIPILKKQLLTELEIENRNLQFMETEYFYSKLSQLELDNINLIFEKIFEPVSGTSDGMSNLLPTDNFPFTRAICFITFIDNYWLFKIEIGYYSTGRAPTEPSSEVTYWDSKEFFIKYKKIGFDFEKETLDAYPEYPNQYYWKRVFNKEIETINFQKLSLNK